MIKYSIDCFEKKRSSLVKRISLPNKKVNLRILLKKWSKREVLDNIKIDKKLKIRLEIRFHVHIPISSYDCFFCETR